MTNLGKIKILETFYTLRLWKDFKALQEYAKARDERYGQKKDEDNPLDGFCDYLSKEINIFTDEYTDAEYFDMTLRHEICHAFLYEIGYTHHDDEELIDKLSKWIPRINNIFNQGRMLIENARVKEEPRSTQNSEACVPDSK